MERGEPYRALVGVAWDALAPGVQLAHSPPIFARGALRIVRADRGLGGLVARVMKLPPAGEAVSTTLRMTANGDQVEWTREFGPVRAVSHQTVANGHIREIAGPFVLEFALRPEGRAIRHVQTETRLFGIRLPTFVGPVVRGFVGEGPDDASWRVEVEIGHALIGALIAYSGIMRVTIE